MDKASLRRHMRARLHELDRQAMREKSAAICEYVMALTHWDRLGKVSCYQSHLDLHEVDTAPIIEAIRLEQPHITLDIVSPHADAPMPMTRYDLIIVPLVAFDDDNNRLGRGGGWYDRFLATQPQAHTIGLAFTCQRVDMIPTEDFDVGLDEIMTEDGKR